MGEIPHTTNTGCHLIIHRAMKANELSQVGKPASPPLPCPANSPQRVLVVDDDSDARQLSLEVLAGAGYHVEGVKDGAAGWEALETNRYDLVITDNKMPRMTGLEMIEKLHSASRAVPVIMVTGYSAIQDFARKPWLKPDATLQKPFSNAALLEVVKRVLRTDDGNDGGNEARRLQS